MTMGDFKRGRLVVNPGGTVSDVSCAPGHGYWIQTHTGRAFDLLYPSVEMVDIADIAQALSMLCRFTGHTSRFYSVAEHSVWCARFAPEELRLAALLHDAHEAYVGDVSSPLKRLIGPEYITIARNVQSVIDARFGVVRTAHADSVIEHIDRRMLMTEARGLLAPEPGDWGIDAEPYAMWFDTTLCPELARQSFLEHLHSYWGGDRDR